MEEKVKAKVILEVLGGPKEHVETVIKNIVEKIRNEKKIKVVSENIFPVEPVDKLFTSFAEMEIDTEDIKELTNFCFDYMPSSVEILEPSTFKFEALGYVNILNDILARLHKVDAVVKNVNMHNILLRKELEKLKNPEEVKKE